MSRGKKLQEALGSLADLFEYGHIQADTQPVSFIEGVVDEVTRLRADIARVTAELAETKAALDVAERKLACSPAHALDSAADKIDALRKRMAELPCTRCEKARADADRLRKAWALREITKPEPCYMPPDVAAMITEHAGQDIGECTRCGQRAPLAWLPNGRACAWGCSTKASVT